MNRKFRILPGFTPDDSFEEFISKGIGTVYVGFYDSYSEKKWPVAFNTVNRRGEGGSFYGRKSFSAFIGKAEKLKISVYVTFNVNYISEQIPWIYKNIKYVSSFSAVKGVIVNDLNILLWLKKIKYKKDIVISTLGTTLNSYCADFYKSFGAKKIVLDRQLTCTQITDILKKFSDTEFEHFFLMADGCFFIDGYCSSLHIQETDEKARYDNSVKSTLCMSVFNKLSEKSFKKMLPYKCNICMLFYLKNFNNITLKIPNRTITDSKGAAIIESVLKIEKKLNEKNIVFNDFQRFCAGILYDKKHIKCNKKICLCRDLYGKSIYNR